MTRRAAVSLAVVLFLGGGASAENLVSGPQVGEKVGGGFSVLFLNGDQAGKKRCPVSVEGYGLTALIFANEVNEPLTALLKRIDKQLEKAPARRPGSDRPGVFVLFDSDDPALKRQLLDLIDKEGLKQVVLCFGKSQAPVKCEVAEESVLTVVVANDKAVVTANFAFRKEEFSTGWADAIVKALSQVLPRE